MIELYDIHKSLNLTLPGVKGLAVDCRLLL